MMRRQTLRRIALAVITASALLATRTPQALAVPSAAAFAPAAASSCRVGDCVTSLTGIVRDCLEAGQDPTVCGSVFQALVHFCLLICSA